MSAILIIDDDPAVATSMQRALQGLYQIEVVNGAARAGAQLTQGKRYDAILCDLSMPQRDGLQFYEEVLALDSAQAQRIIFVSGGIYSDEIQTKVSRLKNTLLQKPFTSAKIREVVHSVATA
jgi:two-component system NtrC family sensor kinase